MSEKKQGRPSTMDEAVKVSHIIPADMHRALQTQAAALDRSVSWVVREAIGQYLKGGKE